VSVTYRDVNIIDCDFHYVDINVLSQLCNERDANQISRILFYRFRKFVQRSPSSKETRYGRENKAMPQ